MITTKDFNVFGRHELEFQCYISTHNITYARINVLLVLKTIITMNFVFLTFKIPNRVSIVIWLELRRLCLILKNKLSNKRNFINSYRGYNTGITMKKEKKKNLGSMFCPPRFDLGWSQACNLSCEILELSKYTVSRLN